MSDLDTALAAFDHAASVPVQGRRQVGLVSPQIPAELVRAADAAPILLWPQFTGSSDLADRYMEYFFEAPLRHLFDAAAGGALDHLDLLVVPRTSESFTKFYLYLREVQRQEPARNIPTLHLFDLLHTQGESVRRHNRGEVERLYHRVCALTGTAPSADALLGAADDEAAIRTELQALLPLRRSAVLTGCDALRIYAGVRAMTPDQVGNAVRAVIKASSTVPVRTGARLLLLGPSLPHPALCARIEATGATIVAEEHPWGGRVFEPAARSGDTLGAIAERARHVVPSARSFSAGSDWIRQAASAANAQGAVFVIPSNDDSYGWDYPACRDLCRALGLRTLLLRPVDRDPADAGAQIDEFLAAEHAA
ncbi:2-hydroxyacyl-CoA dehydratase family protein [Roseiterribacter gracilis]|uniref:2-hydroxyacyl-CoA dehydratase n=1 Tax=Roseiterribacter gracilis TaxID=2812848 RepID=A0A8S8XK75_9PROT|nr:hypothetical protein TMPK1_38320 [Rhodospirillales bacterium TMPK1]